MPTKIITLTTDFGLTDGYVAAMKGVILSISPGSCITDITHAIEPQNINQAAIVLETATVYFPKGTIHVIVVDPGVGTARALLAVKANNQIFLAPDNGVLGLVLKRYAGFEARRIENKSLFLDQVSRTFHGRDILAPVAAHLAEGISFQKVGSVVTDIYAGDYPAALVQGNVIRGQITNRDHFGNLMTNISQRDLEKFDPASLEVRASYTRVTGLSGSYSDVEKGELVCLIGSGGYLEIALREGSAADKLRFSLGTEVEIVGKSKEV